MKCLSGRQPWWWAITTKTLASPKRIENRVMMTVHGPRPPTWHRHRGLVLLHASAGCTRRYYDEAVAWMRAAGVIQSLADVPPLAKMPRGGIVGRARIVGVIHDRQSAEDAVLCVPNLDLRWWMRDRWGFVLADVEPLPFTPIKGQLGLFDVDESTLTSAHR